MLTWTFFESHGIVFTRVMSGITKNAKGMGIELADIGQVDTRVVVSNGIEVKNAIARKSNKASTIKLSTVARLSANGEINSDERFASFT